MNTYIMENLSKPVNIFSSVRDGSVEDVRQCLDSNPALVNAKQNNGTFATPLMLACGRGHYDMVCLLLERGADIEPRDFITQDTCMHYAASSGKADILEMLVEHGGQHMQPAEQMVNIKNAAGRTPLFAAVCESAGDNEAVSYLLSKGSDTHTYDNLHNTALLHRLSQYYDDNVETTKLLVEHRIESGASGYDLEFRNKLGETALLLACKQGLVQTTRFLIEKGADVNARDNRQEGPLDHCARASQDNGIEMASALIAAGADTRQRAEGSKDSTPLQIAISRRAYSERFLMLLLDSNADLEAPSGLAADRPLHSACLRGNLFAVEQLVARGADVNAKNKQGDTPLHLCDPLGKKGPDAWRIIPVLILNGADTSLRNSRGKLPVDTMKDARCKASFLEAVEQRDVQELAPILK